MTCMPLLFSPWPPQSPVPRALKTLAFPKTAHESSPSPVTKKIRKEYGIARAVKTRKDNGNKAICGLEPIVEVHLHVDCMVRFSVSWYSL